MHILVVCGVNFSRSQSLAHHLKEQAREEGYLIEVDSAGVNSKVIGELAKIGVKHQPINERMIVANDKMNKGYSSRAKTAAKPISKELIDWADIVIAVDPKTRTKILEKYPSAVVKVQLAKEMAAGKILPLKAGFKDAYTDGKARRYRKGAKQSTLKSPQPKAFWLMNREASHIAKAIVRKFK